MVCLLQIQKPIKLKILDLIWIVSKSQALELFMKKKIMPNKRVSFRIFFSRAFAANQFATIIELVMEWRNLK